MAGIKENFGEGGANLAPGGAAGDPSLATVLREEADDFETIRLAWNALLAKLDADSGVNSNDYAATLGIAPGGIKTKKV